MNIIRANSPYFTPYRATQNDFWNTDPLQQLRDLMPGGAGAFQPDQMNALHGFMQGLAHSLGIDAGQPFGLGDQSSFGLGSDPSLFSGMPRPGTGLCFGQHGGPATLNPTPTPSMPSTQNAFGPYGPGGASSATNFGANGATAGAAAPAEMDPLTRELGNLLSGLNQQLEQAGAMSTPVGAALMGLVEQVLRSIGFFGPEAQGGAAALGSGLPGSSGLAGGGPPGQGGYAGGGTNGTGGAYGPLPPGGMNPPSPGTPPYSPALPPSPGVPDPYGAPSPYGPTVPPEGVEPGLGPIPDGLDYRDLSMEQREQISGLDPRERAVLHLWGIQMASEGSNDGGVLLNVEQNPSSFTQAEQELARELLEAERERHDGQVTGQSLDQEFFRLYEKISGEDISGRYTQAPIRFADGPVDMQARLNGENGLNDFENQVLQLWGHSPLFNQGRIDGNILQYALDNPNERMEVNLRDSDLRGLLEADRASDGVINGDSLDNAFMDTLDRLYLDGAPEASLDRTMADALSEAQMRRNEPGVLPPPREGLGEIEGIPPGHPRTGGGGSCPFFNGGGAGPEANPVYA